MSESAELLKVKTAELQAALLSKHPSMPSLLKTIHETLRQYPENVTLLSEADIQAVVQGLSVITKQEFAATLSKPAASKSVAAKIKNLGVNAF